MRSVRNGKKVRQETVAYLGELDAKGRAKASAVAKHFLGKRNDQLDLFEDRSSLDSVPVNLKKVRVERGRVFGDVWLGWLLWQALELDAVCEDIFPRRRETIPWSQMVLILVLARLCEPSSELYIAEDWYRRTALEDLLGVKPEAVYDARLYRTLDRLLSHKRDLEVHLKKRLGELFDLDYDLLLYDVTSTYFEGEAKGNKLAQRGEVLREMRQIFDVVFIDTGAGIGPVVQWFNSLADHNLVVLTSEPTALTDAYALMKVLNNERGLTVFHLIVNNVASPDEGEKIVERIRGVTDRFLSFTPHLLGSIPKDDILLPALRDKMPAVKRFPGSALSVAFAELSEKTIALEAPTGVGATA